MDDKGPNIIIIKGAPGSGKSTTGKYLAKFFPNGVRLEVDIVRQMVISVDWTNQNEHIKMLEVSVGLVKDFIQLGFEPVIVVDTFSGNKLEHYLEKLNLIVADKNIAIFGLYASDEELEKRLSARPDEEYKDVDVSIKLNAQILRNKLAQEIQINTTELLPEETASRIYDILQIDKSIF